MIHNNGSVEVKEKFLIKCLFCQEVLYITPLCEVKGNCPACNCFYYVSSNKELIYLVYHWTFEYLKINTKDIKGSIDIHSILDIKKDDIPCIACLIKNDSGEFIGYEKKEIVFLKKKEEEQ